MTPPDRKPSLRDHVLTTVRLIAANPKAAEGELIYGLCCLGYEELEANLLVFFVPLGLARAVIHRLPQPVEMSDHAIALQDDRELTIPLMLVSEFVEAERLGEETYLTGIISSEDFVEVAQMSAEFNVVSDTLSAGLTPLYIAPPVVLGLAETPGFDDWYRGIKDQTDRAS